MFAGVIWVVFSRSYWSICHQFVFVCVCVHCVCILLSPFDGLIWVPLCRQQGFCSDSSQWHQLPCGRSGTICSRRVLNTPQQWSVWDDLKGAYAASIDFHIWEHLYHCWSPIRAQQAAHGLGAQLEQVTRWQTAEELCCLFIIIVDEILQLAEYSFSCL